MTRRYDEACRLGIVERADDPIRAVADTVEAVPEDKPLLPDAEASLPCALALPVPAWAWPRFTIWTNVSITILIRL